MEVPDKLKSMDTMLGILIKVRAQTNSAWILGAGGIFTVFQATPLYYILIALRSGLSWYYKGICLYLCDMLSLFKSYLFCSIMLETPRKVDHV